MLKFRENIVITLLLILGYLVVSCKGKTEEVILKSPDGKIEKVTQYKVNGETKDMIKETRFYPNGNKQIDGGYKDGKREGKWSYWFENGTKQSDGYFENGLRKGAATVWDETGKIIYTGNYKKGKPEGTWYIYGKSGEKESEIVYQDGKVFKQNKLK